MSDVKFIRVRGRIVPIRGKGEGKTRKMGAGERVHRGARLGSEVGAAIGGGAALANLVSKRGRVLLSASKSKVGFAIGATLGIGLQMFAGAVNGAVVGGLGNLAFGPRRTKQKKSAKTGV